MFGYNWIWVEESKGVTQRKQHKQLSLVFRLARPREDYLFIAILYKGNANQKADYI